MEINKELNFIINDNKLEKRTEKSKYFTEEFFKKCGIKKYRYLLEDYNFIDFERDTYCRRGETKNPEEDYYIDGLWLEDSNIEHGLNFLMELDEYYQETGEYEKLGRPDYYLTDNLGPFSRLCDYIFIDKTTSKIWTAIQDEDLSNMIETIYNWELIADNFDEFIDKLYIEKTENRVVNIAQGRKVLKEMDEYIKERDKFKNE